MFPDPLPLARSTVDRDALSRQDPELISRMLTSSVAQVLIVDGARIAIERTASTPELLQISGNDFPAAASNGREPAQFAYLGSDAHNSYLVVDAGERSGDLLNQIQQKMPHKQLDWASPRQFGTALSDSETGLVTTALALMQWHRRHRHCPHCGATTLSIESGWVRQCPIDRSQHFPRTDPAVIMAITDDADRLLLGRGAAWPEHRFSTLAGFVEPGETPENAVRREVYEEASIQVGAVKYRGSQPWPFPASLMLAYTGNALSTEIIVDGVEMLEARWFTRPALAADVEEGRVILPGKASVARVLIEHWYGQPLGTSPNHEWS